MITNEEKIKILIDKINTVDFMVESFISHADEFGDKYVLEDELAKCIFKKDFLSQKLESLKESPDPLD